MHFLKLKQQEVHILEGDGVVVVDAENIKRRESCFFCEMLENLGETKIDK